MSESFDADAVIIVDGSADDIVGRLVAAGWALRERTGKVAGKRVRYLEAPVPE